jgi:6-phosphogluconolactonase (cycloisomerase 2 family)
MAGKTMRLKLGAVLLAGLVGLSGCTGFFVPEPGGGGSGGTGTGFTYVINSLTSTVSGFSIGTGKLTTVPNMPYQLGFVPVAAAVTINNSFLYVAGPGAIYCYIIGSDGSLTTPTNGAGQAIVYALSLDVSPDGNWLIALNGTTTQLNIYQINKTTGALALTTSVPYSITNTSIPPKMVRVSPDGNYIFAALGSNGDAVFSFNTSSGAATLEQTLSVSSQTSDNALVADSSSKYLYIARSGTDGGLAVYSIGSLGALTAISGSPFLAGAQPLDVRLYTTTTAQFVYVANGSDGNISGYSVNNGVPSVLSGSPYTSGATVRSLVLDSTNKYLLAGAFAGSPDLTMYSFDTTVAGKLVQATSTATGTDPAGVLVVTATH